VQAARADLYLDLAVALYEAGASAQRVSDSVQWLAKTLGDDCLNLFVGNEIIELSVLQNEYVINRLHMIREPFRVDVSVLHRISDFLHRIPDYNRDLLKIRKDLDRIRSGARLYPVPVTVLLTAIACSAFGWINNADSHALWVILISAVCALSMRYRFGKEVHNLYGTALMTALAGGVSAAVLIPFSLTGTPDVALISSVLFLIPGVLLINGGLDIIRDHISSGIARLTSVATQVCIISGSLLIPLSMIQPSFLAGSTVPGPIPPFLTVCLAAGVAAGGFGVLMNTPLRILPGCILCGIIARLIRETGIACGIDPFLSIFGGMVVATVLAMLIGKWLHVPEVIIAFIAGIPMVPGLAIIQGLQGLFSLAHGGTSYPAAIWLSAGQHVLYAIVVVFALIGGIIFPILIISRNSPRI
jgi:uncharacterized membrane protein YjjP (DUF1212 family)